MPTPILPVRNLSSSDVLYGDRITSYRWEVLSHGADGKDQLVGTLDGVTDGSLQWTYNAAVKGGGKASVADLTAADTTPGMLRIGDLHLESLRVRPVCSIQGLPDNPLGVFLVSNADEEWEDTGRVWSLELLDKCTVLDQNAYENTKAVAAGTPILAHVATIIANGGEYLAYDASNTIATSANMVWEAGTSRLKVINDLLDVANYNALWVDGYGNFQTTPRVLPADRSLNYEVLNVPRELVDGETSIYTPSWTRSRDSFSVPNKVIAVQAAGGDDQIALTGTWTNTDPNSPYSYPSRGRWITYVVDGIEVPAGTTADQTAFLQKRAQTTLIQMSSPQAQVKIEHLPIPVRVGDVVRFANSRAGIDTRHVITRTQLDVVPLGIMSSTLQEVISL